MLQFTEYREKILGFTVRGFGLCKVQKNVVPFHQSPYQHGQLSQTIGSWHSWLHEVDKQICKFLSFLGMVWFGIVEFNVPLDIV